MSRPECNCPPLVDVMRGRAGETKPECPVHPTPPGLMDKLMPLIQKPADHRLDFARYAEYGFTAVEVSWEPEPNGGSYGMGC